MFDKYFNQLSNSSRIFEQLTSFGLTSNIKDIETYLSLSEQGMVLAFEYLSSLGNKWRLTNNLLKEIHYITFHKIHPWAGKFRQNGEIACFAGFVCADSSRIAFENELAFKQLLRFGDFCDSLSDFYFESLAFTHVRLLRNHPFKDGNGRVLRLLLLSQLIHDGYTPTNYFGDSREQYLSTIREACSRKTNFNLTPLANTIRLWVKMPLMSLPFPSPFRISPFMESDNRLCDNTERMLEVSLIRKNKNT